MEGSVRLTPHERAGQTRRQRTLDAVVMALDGLLAERPYDEITVADIVGRAGIGAATFYQVVRDKPRAAGFSVWRDLVAHLRVGPSDVTAVDPAPALADLLTTLGRYGAAHPEKAHALCRAYDTHVAHLRPGDDGDHPVRRLLGVVEAHLERAARHGACPPGITETGVAGFVLTQALMAGQAPHADDWRTRVERLHDLLTSGGPHGDL